MKPVWGGVESRFTTMHLTYPQSISLEALSQTTVTSNETIPVGYNVVAFTVNGTGSAAIFPRNSWIDGNRHYAMNVTNLHPTTLQYASMDINVLLMKI